MKNFRNLRGFAGRISRGLCLILSVGMLMIGVPITNAHACYVSTDDPADGCIREVKLDSPQMSVTGRSVSVPPGTEVTFTAHAINESGQSTGCANGWKFRVDGRDIDMGDAANDTIRVRSGSSGMPEVAAVCKDNPSIGHAPVTIKNSVWGVGLRAATELAFLGVSSSATPSPPLVSPSTIPPPPTPGQPTGTEKSPAKGLSAGKVLGTIGLVGVAVGGGLLLGSALADLSEPVDSTSSSGSSCPSLSQCCGGGHSGGCGIVSSCGCPSGTRDGGICAAGRPCNTQGGFTAGSRMCWCQ